jgi:hypothetical protein
VPQLRNYVVCDLISEAPERVTVVMHAYVARQQHQLTCMHLAESHPALTCPEAELDAQVLRSLSGQLLVDCTSWIIWLWDDDLGETTANAEESGGLVGRN